MKLFTIRGGKVSTGAVVGTFALSGGGKIPAILTGERGRGRKLAVLPVQLLPDSFREWQENEYVEMDAAQLGQTKAGKPKLLQKESSETTEKCLVVFLTGIGFRGGNCHTGDRVEQREEKNYLGESVIKNIFAEFPGTWLSEGFIAQGAAGRMGGGRQGVAVIPVNNVFRTAYSGRLYGGPAAHYYIYNAGAILAATSQEREIADLF